MPRLNRIPVIVFLVLALSPLLLMLSPSPVESLRSVACERKCASPAHARAVAASLTHAWDADFDGARPTDADLQSYSDAVDILNCIGKEAPNE